MDVSVSEDKRLEEILINNDYTSLQSCFVR